MSKQLLKKELILIDFAQNEFSFYSVEVLSVGYNELQVITNYGKLGNKGKENIVRFDNYKEAMKLAYKKIYERKAKGYLSKEKMRDAIIAASTFFQIEEKSKKKSLYPIKKQTCDICKKEINQKTYKNINEWARGEGNWDKKTTFIGYKKVLCIDCQIEHDLFKKRMP